MGMSNVFPTTGAINVGCDNTHIVIEQHAPDESTPPAEVLIPLPILRNVLSAIFRRIELSDLNDAIEQAMAWKEVKEDDENAANNHRENGDG